MASSEYHSTLPCCWGGCGVACGADILAVTDDNGTWFRIVPQHERCRWPSMDCETVDLAIQSWTNCIEGCRNSNHHEQLTLF